MLALQRTTASTWGATTPKARQVYQAVVRPAMAYGEQSGNSLPKQQASLRA